MLVEDPPKPPSSGCASPAPCAAPEIVVKAKTRWRLISWVVTVLLVCLFAAIAIPNFLRSRKRSRATSILEDVRLIDGAKDQYAIENSQLGTVEPTWDDLKPYFKKGTRLYNAASLPGDSLTDSSNFWGSYGPP